MGHSLTSRTRIARGERATQALELRKSGLNFKQIGRKMGFSEQRAHRLVTEELARLNAKRAETAAEVTRLELERLDTLLAGIWDKAAQGDLKAVGRVLDIMARRAKMLGLDAPDQSSASAILVLLQRLQPGDLDPKVRAQLAEIVSALHRQLSGTAAPLTDQERAEAAFSIFSRHGLLPAPMPAEPDAIGGDGTPGSFEPEPPPAPHHRPSRANGALGGDVPPFFGP